MLAYHTCVVSLAFLRTNRVERKNIHADVFSKFVHAARAAATSARGVGLLGTTPSPLRRTSPPVPRPTALIGTQPAINVDARQQGAEAICRVVLRDGRLQTPRSSGAAVSTRRTTTAALTCSKRAAPAPRCGGSRASARHRTARPGRSWPPVVDPDPEAALQPARVRRRYSATPRASARCTRASR